MVGGAITILKHMSSSHPRVIHFVTSPVSLLESMPINPFLIILNCISNTPMKTLGFMHPGHMGGMNLPHLQIMFQFQ